jgi:glycosyltransferase involved in cell wall biosynthesis
MFIDHVYCLRILLFFYFTNFNTHFKDRFLDGWQMKYSSYWNSGYMIIAYMYILHYKFSNVHEYLSLLLLIDFFATRHPGCHYDRYKDESETPHPQGASYLKSE